MNKIWSRGFLQLFDQSCKLHDFCLVGIVNKGYFGVIQQKWQFQQQCKFSQKKQKNKLGFTQDEFFEEDDEEDEDEAKKISSRAAMEQIEEDMLTEAPETIKEKTRWQKKFGDMPVSAIFPEGYRKLSLTRKLSKRRRVENIYRSERFKDVWWHLRFKQPGYGRDPWLNSGYNHKYSGGVVSEMDAENYFQQYKKAETQVEKTKQQLRKEIQQKEREALKKKKSGKK